MKMRQTKNCTVHDLVSIGLFVGLIVICSWISVPFVIPFTLQTLGIFTAVGLLGGRKGTLCVLTYLLLGAIGMPVFAGFSGGLGALFGANGGYLFGFLCCALVMWGMERMFGKGQIVLLCSMAAGLLVCYFVGTLWYMAVYAKTAAPIGWWAALSRCVFPFLVPDSIKIFTALFLVKRLRKATVSDICHTVSNKA